MSVFLTEVGFVLHDCALGGEKFILHFDCLNTKLRDLIEAVPPQRQKDNRVLVVQYSES